MLSVLGVQPYLTSNGINYTSLMIFCLAWGFGGAFISLAISRKMAKWMMGVKLIAENTADMSQRSLVRRVHEFARRAGLQKMPEVGIYESDEINAFATGPSKSRSLVAVSSGLLDNMTEAEVDGVLAHEIAHIANGDMVTMTLLQGVMNAFVMFLARVAGFFVGQFVDEEKRGFVQFGVIIALDIFLGILGSVVVASFSRRREFRADEGGARLAGRDRMIAALERLKLNYSQMVPAANRNESSIASLKIFGRKAKFGKLFSTHPDLDLRIANLKGGF